MTNWRTLLDANCQLAALRKRFNPQDTRFNLKKNAVHGLTPFICRAMTKILENINRRMTRRVVYHVSFWFVLLGILTISEMRSSDDTFGHLLGNELINVFFYALIYYINSDYLIPKYLVSNKLGQYLGLLVGVSVILTPIKVFILFQRFKGNPSAQNFLIDHQAYYYLISMMTAGVSTIVKITSDWVKQSRSTATFASLISLIASSVNRIAPGESLECSALLSI